MTKETVITETQNTFYLTVNDLEEAMKQKHLYADYALLDETWKKRFDDYMTGKKRCRLRMIRSSNACSIRTDIQTGCHICSAQFLVNQL